MKIRNKKTGQCFNVMANSRFSSKIYEKVDEKAEKIALKPSQKALGAKKDTKTIKQSSVKKKAHTKRNKAKKEKK